MKHANRLNLISNLPENLIQFFYAEKENSDLKFLFLPIEGKSIKRRFFACPCWKKSFPKGIRRIERI